MKRSPGNISKSDPSTVPAVDLTEVIHWYICMWTFSSLLTPFSHSMLYLCVAGSARLGRAAIPASNDSKGSCLWNYSWLRSTSGRLNIFSPMCDLFTRNLAPRLPSVRRSGERSKTCSRARAPPVRYHNNHHLHLKPLPRYTIVCANRTWYITSVAQRWNIALQKTLRPELMRLVPPLFLRLSTTNPTDNIPFFKLYLTYTLSERTKWSGRTPLTTLI